MKHFSLHLRASLITLLSLLAISCTAPLNYTNFDGPRYTGCGGDDAVNWNPRTGRGETNGSTTSSAPGELRVVSFNIKFSIEIDLAIQLIRSDPHLNAADVLLLQEMDKPGVRKIADSLGYCWVYYPAVRHPQSERDFGNAILSRYPFIEDHKVLLPHRGRFGRTRRIATAATLDVNGVAVRVYSLHLATWIELGPGSREDQARAVIEDANRFTGPVIIGGDLNARKLGFTFADGGYDWITQDMKKTTSFASLDHLFIRKLKPAPGEATGKLADSRGASDHVPIWGRFLAPRPEGGQDMNENLPAFDTFWNYNDPAGTEANFRELLPAAIRSGDVAYRAELLTQIARTLGLQQKFTEAHAVLDEADALITPEMTSPRVRSLLERGRAINSSGDPEGSIALFNRAFTEAGNAGLENYAVDAAHMLGIVTKGEDSIAWNVKAMAMAEAATDPKARRWRGSLSNNLGWTYFDLGRYQDALDMFEKHLTIRTEQMDTAQMAIARWSIAKMYRHLGRVEEALAMQRSLLEDPGRKDNDGEGYTQEEIAECLLALGRGAEAAPHFARAWRLLHEDPWLSRDETERLERLKQLGGVQ